MTVKDNIRKFKVHKGKGKNPVITMPRFIREVRTATSERFSILNGELEDIGTIDIHINETIYATLVIVPEMEQIAVEMLVGLIKIELLNPLGLEIESLNVYKGVTKRTLLTEGDFYDRSDTYEQCTGECDNCDRADCSVDEKDESDEATDPSKDTDR